MDKVRIIGILQQYGSMVDISAVYSVYHSDREHLGQAPGQQKMDHLAAYNLEAYQHLMSGHVRVNAVEKQALEKDEIIFENMHRALEKYLNQYNPDQENFNLFVTVVSLYLTFIAEKPLHPPGFFHEEGEVIYKKGMVCCPIKRSQLKDPEALCHFCASAVC